MVLSDNGVCFAGVDGTGSSFEPVLAAAGVRLIHSRPYHPETCGKVERFHATLKRWLSKQPLATSMGELQAQLGAFAAHFNHERRSSAGGELTAAERHAASTPAQPSPQPIELGAPAPKITITASGVNANGTVAIADWRVSVGTEHVGRRLTVIRTASRR